MLAAYMDKGGAGVAPPGVHEGVQTCSFVRASRGACNPKVAPCQFRPATNIGHADELRAPLVGALSCSSIHGSQRHEVTRYLARTRVPQRRGVCWSASIRAHAGNHLVNVFPRWAWRYRCRVHPVLLLEPIDTVVNSLSPLTVVSSIG